MHHQRANAYNDPDSATCTHGHARAVSDRHNRADQHAGANTYSIAIPDSNCHCYSHRDTITHAVCFTAVYCNTHAAPDANGHGNPDTYTHAIANSYSDTDASPDADSYPRSNFNTKSHATANRNTSSDGDSYTHTVADTNGDADTASKHRRATRGPGGILRRD